MPGGSVTHFAYNARGEMTSATNAKNQSIGINYDAAGQLGSLSLPSGTITHSYDAAGFPVTTTGTAGEVVTRTFDVAGRLTSRTDQFGRTLSFSYDAAGNLASITYPGGQVVSYTYFANRKLSTVTDWAGRTTGYSYDAAGRLISETLPNGSTVSYVYDAAGRLVSKTTMQGLNQLFRFDYQYDAAGKMTTETSTGTLKPTLTSASALNVVDTEGKLAMHNADAYVYDADGNMTSRSLNGITTAITYNSLNRMTGYGADSYAYDPEGNLVSSTVGDVTRNYTILTASKLPEILEEYDSAGNVVSHYVYGLGLISREDAGGNLSVYHYDWRAARGEYI